MAVLASRQPAATLPGHCICNSQACLTAAFVRLHHLPQYCHGLCAFAASADLSTTGSAMSGYDSPMSPLSQANSYNPPGPGSPGRRSTLLAVCPQLPPSMQRNEWCLDDYVITDKLYKGYASMGEWRLVRAIELMPAVVLVWMQIMGAVCAVSVCSVCPDAVAEASHQSPQPLQQLLLLSAGCC